MRNEGERDVAACGCACHSPFIIHHSSFPSAAMIRVALAIIWLLHFLPLALLAPVGRAFGLLLYVIAADRRRVATTNLRLCFPDWSKAKRARVVRGHFQAFGRAVIERGILWWSSRERILRIVRFEGIEHWQAARDR